MGLHIDAHKTVCHVLPFLSMTYFWTSAAQKADPRYCINFHFCFGVLPTRIPEFMSNLIKHWLCLKPPASGVRAERESCVSTLRQLH